MKYLSAYLLAVIGGKTAPTVKDIEHIIGSAGLDVDMEDAKKVVDALAGKSITEIITQGKAKLATVPSGGGGGAAASAGAGKQAAAAAPTAAPVETKKAKEEVKEESEDEDLGFGLFD